MIKKLIITIIILFLTTMLGVALSEINKHDLSVHKAETCNLKEKGPIYLVTYGDGDVYISNMKVLAESALNNCVDVVYMYRKEHLDEAFVEKNKKILDKKRGAGYWLWKPYIVLKTLENIPEGAIVIYFDSGIKIVHPLDRFINKLDSNDILLVDNTHTNKPYMKRDLLKFMNMDNEEVLNQKQLSACMFVVRNTVRSKEFLTKWLEIGELGWTIDDSPSKEVEYPEFIEHRHDQSILSLLSLQNTQGIKVSRLEDLLEDVWQHKRRSMEKSLFVTRDGKKMQMSILGKRLDEILKLWRRYVR